MMKKMDVSLFPSALKKTFQTLTDKWEEGLQN